jgi:hypothetical protein
MQPEIPHLIYLFRFDGARENDEFSNLMRGDIPTQYAGIEMKVGPGWVPDFLMIQCNKQYNRCQFTLIELEATETQARISARKYLPESSANIVDAFHGYLKKVLSQCRTTADARRQDFDRLRDFLLKEPQVEVRTAGSLRNSTDFVESLPLIDSSGESVRARERSTSADAIVRFAGELRLTPHQHKMLSRTLRILDAAVRGVDHSGATLKSWLISRTQPLRQ